MATATKASATTERSNAHVVDATSSAAAHTGRLKRIWSKLGLDLVTMQKMLKVSLPPTIAVAMFQSSVVANYFLTDGYFIALLAFAMLPILPRARYIRLVLVSIVLLCVYVCICLLAIWSALQARRHTTKQGDESGYNSSQAAVLAVWLFAITFANNAAKDVFRQDQISFTLAGILEIALLSSGVDFRTMDQAITATLHLLESFLLGMGLSCGVSLLFFPLSCRDVFFKNLSGYLQSLGNVLKAQNSYMRSLEHEDPWFSASATTTTSEHEKHDKALASLYVAASKVRAEQTFAQQEFAYAKLPASELAPLVDSALRIMPALSGLGFIFQILAQIQKDQGFVEGSEDEKQAVQRLQAMMQVICEPCEKLSFVMAQGMDHVQIVLELKKAPEQGVGQQEVKPGTSEFAAWYDEQTADFQNLKEVIARVWYQFNGVELPPHLTELELDSLAWEEINERLGQQTRPFTIIYIAYLVFAASRELAELIAFVDSRAREGVFEKRHLTLPTFKHLQKWFGLLAKRESDPNLPAATSGLSGNARQRGRRQQLNDHKDPEHLAATRWYERAGNLVRKVPRFLRSDHAVHGFRVACAIMSVAVGFYVETASKWFSTNRWLWALLAIQLSMTPTAGLAFFLFLCRIGGTLVAMITAFIVYYIVDGQTAGVIVFLWVYFLIAGYLLLKYPFYTGVIIVSIFATVVMVANELQDKKLGFARVEALGQGAHAEYIIAPTRLAIVSAGVAIAYFWTIVPYPISEHSALRKDLADTLFTLASYQAMVAHTVTLRASGSEKLATRNQNQLAKRRVKQFTKLQFLFAQLKQHLMYTDWQIVLGGKFPKKQYGELIRLCEQVCITSSVIGYASSSFVRAMEEARGSGKGPSRWLTDFQQLLHSVDIVSNEVTAALLILSNHMANGNPFPPHFEAPDSASLTRKVEEMNSELMRVSHIMEPAYTAFVTIVMAGKATRQAIARQFEICKELVGVLDFSSLIDLEEQPLMLDELETGGGLS